MPCVQAYSLAKFAVRGLSEGLIADFAARAPHVSVHCVMPGYIATNMGVNTTWTSRKSG